MKVIKNFHRKRPKGKHSANKYRLPSFKWTNRSIFDDKRFFHIPLLLVFCFWEWPSGAIQNSRGHRLEWCVNQYWRMTYYGCSLPTSEPFYCDLALIHESLTANFRRESVTLQSKMQNFKEVLDLRYMKLGGRVSKSFLTDTMSYIPNLFSALCQSAFLIAWQSGHGFSLVVVDSCYILPN